MGFFEQNMASRAPGEYFLGIGLCEPPDRFETLTTGIGRITSSQLQYSATICRSTMDFVPDVQPVEHIEAQQTDMRSLQHIAPGVEDQVWRFCKCRMGRRAQSLQQLRCELKP